MFEKGVDLRLNVFPQWAVWACVPSEPLVKTCIRWRSKTPPPALLHLRSAALSRWLRSRHQPCSGWAPGEPRRWTRMAATGTTWRQRVESRSPDRCRWRRTGTVGRTQRSTSTRARTTILQRRVWRLTGTTKGTGRKRVTRKMRRSGALRSICRL